MVLTPFLTFLTPTYRRPKGLATCLASVQTQTAVARIQQVVLVDHVGVGIAGMYASLPTYASVVRGQYVHILCDDDALASPTVVEQVEQFAKDHQFPAVIIVSAEKGGLVWPVGEPWPPRMGLIDLGCIITRADVWQVSKNAYGKRYEGDWDFMNDVESWGHEAAQCDLLFVRGAVSRGAAEAA